MPVILALWGLGQEDFKFNPLLGYTARPCLKKQNKIRTTRKQNETLPHPNKKQNMKPQQKERKRNFEQLKICVLERFFCHPVGVEMGGRECCSNTTHSSYSSFFLAFHWPCETSI
jgi:hypothetical protein